MNEKVESLRQEYRDLQQKLQDPDVYGNPDQLKKLGKRSRELEPLMSLMKEYDRYQQALKDEADSASDPELAELAAEDAEEARKHLPELEERIKLFLIPKDPLDSHNAMLEVRAGTGGEEASLFAAELIRMYIRYAEEKNWKTELIDKTDADGGGIKEAVIRIEGDDVYGHLKYEGGVHRVQRIPATENKGRVHTSAATVAVLPEVEETDVTIKTEDLRIDTFRAGGAGGQHVNKTESAVRITHVPSGVVVSCQTERSQLKNRLRCMDMLRSKLFTAHEEARAEREGSIRSSQVGSGDRSEKIRTYNFPQDRLTDHRIGENFHNLPGIMEGGIANVIEALRRVKEEEKMKESGTPK
jgi:peptide chain release factor 1